MGDFRPNNRGGGFGGNRSGGSRSFGGERRSFGGGNRFGGERRSFGGRDSGRGGFERRTEMHDATCSKCGKECQVPFKPTGSKPVLCSDCFRQSGSGNSFSPRSNERPQSQQTQTGISSEQFNQINSKLDKILSVLSELELDSEEDEDLDEVLDEDAEDSEADKEELN